MNNASAQKCGGVHMKTSANISQGSRLIVPVAATQPINFAGEGDPPALLLHGSIDDTVAPRHSSGLAARLEAAGVPVRHIEYDGIGHIKIMTALSRWTRSSVPSLADIEAFAREVR